MELASYPDNQQADYNTDKLTCEILADLHICLLWYVTYRLTDD